MACGIPSGSLNSTLQLNLQRVVIAEVAAKSILLVMVCLIRFEVAIIGPHLRGFTGIEEMNVHRL